MAAACPLSQGHPDIAATLPPPHCHHSMISHWLESPRTWATANARSGASSQALSQEKRHFAQAMHDLLMGLSLKP